MNKFKSLVIGAFIASSAWSCQGLVDDNVKSPNLPVEESIPTDRADFLLAGVQLSNMLLQQGEVARLTGMWSGYFTGADRQYISLDKYVVTAGDFDSPYRNVYAALLNAKTMQKKAEIAKNYKLLAVGQILEANIMGTAVALWGDLPYTEAADLNLVNENPKYDSQASIYLAIQAKLTEAVANLAKPGYILNASDIYFKGKVTGTYTKPDQWLKFANSLRARYYLHVKDYAKAKTAASAGILNSADDCAGYHLDDAVSGLNLMYRFMGWEREGYMTAEGAYLPSLMEDRGNDKTDESGRWSWYYSAPGYYSSLDPNIDGIYAPGAPSVIFQAEETHLILAESAARLQNSAEALSHLNMARQIVAANYDQDMSDYVMSDFDATGIAGNAGKSAEQSLLWEILEEKYVALYGQIEGFNDIRRTNNALGIPIKSGAKFPARLLYAQSEVNSNTSFPGIVGLYEPTPVNK